MVHDVKVHPHTIQLAEAAGVIWGDDHNPCQAWPKELQRFRDLVLEDAALQIEAKREHGTEASSGMECAAEIVRELKSS